jgi:phosphate transport system protein
MIQTIKELKALKSNHIEMWNIVQSQVEKSFIALRTGDKLKAHEVITVEPFVNTHELMLDRESADFITLFSPVAVDVRFILSLMKITNNLERIADFAENIAICVKDKFKEPIPTKLFEDLQLEKMMQTTSKMLAMTRDSLIEENTAKCNEVLEMDNILDEINAKSFHVLSSFIKENNEKTEFALYLYTVIKRIERMGDRTSNIVEDIIFFIEARDVRHGKKSFLDKM